MKVHSKKEDIPMAGTLTPKQAAEKPDRKPVLIHPMAVTLTPEQAAEKYSLNIGTLANLRSKKEGPPFLIVGKRKVLYSVADLERWLFSQAVKTKDSLRDES
jgi:hypothetical protein